MAHVSLHWDSIALRPKTLRHIMQTHRHHNAWRCIHINFQSLLLCPTAMMRPLQVRLAFDLGVSAHKQGVFDIHDQLFPFVRTCYWNICNSETCYGASCFDVAVTAGTAVICRRLYNLVEDRKQWRDITSKPDRSKKTLLQRNTADYVHIILFPTSLLAANALIR